MEPQIVFEPGNEPLSQDFVDSILQPAPSHNDYLRVLPVNEYSLNENVALQTGTVVPEPAMILTLLLGGGIAIGRKLRRKA